MAKAVVDKEICIGCETCVGTCPVEAISMNDGKADLVFQGPPAEELRRWKAATPSSTRSR